MNQGMGHLAQQGRKVECSQQGTGNAGAAVPEVQEPLCRKCRSCCTGSTRAAVPEVQESLYRKCRSRYAGSAGAAVPEVERPLYRKCRSRCTGSVEAAVPEVGVLEDPLLGHHTEGISLQEPFRPPVSEPGHGLQQLQLLTEARKQQVSNAEYGNITRKKLNNFRYFIPKNPA
jgi:hypothetical protein